MSKISIAVNSATVNQSLYPNAGSFVYSIQSSLNKVSRVALKNVSIYNSAYAVNSYNNTLKINTASTNYTATIVNGNYSLTAFATALQTALNTSGSSSTFTVTANTANFTLTITSTLSCTFYFATYPLNAALLGFSPTTLSGVAVTSNFVVNLSTIPYYQLYIKEVPNQYQYNGNLGIIYNNVSAGALLSNPNPCNYLIDVDVKPTINLSILTIMLLDNNGNIVNFNGTQLILDFDFFIEN